MKLFCAAAIVAAWGLAPGRSAAMPEGAYTVYQAGQATTFEAMVDRMAQADVVFVGENHDHAQGHALELAILQALASKTPHLALSLEMFERDTQLVVDEYLRGVITQQHFLASSRPWPNYKTDYAPLVEFCREKNLPVIAANAPRRYVNIVSRKGADALKDLPRESRQYLAPLPYSMDLPPEYDKELTGIFDAQHAQAAGMPGMPTTEHMKQAQALWDVTMADSMRRFLRSHRGWKVLQMNGSEHSDRHWGIVDRLHRAVPGLKLLVVSIKPDPGYPNVPADRYRDTADFVIVTPPGPAAAPEGAR